jgi:DNA-binding NarL/FixJ family response regulator
VTLESREHEILELVAGGLTNAEIGRRLTLAPKTVRNYISNVLAKIHAADRADAVVRARRAGLG